MKTLFQKSAIMIVICFLLFGSAVGVAPAYAATRTVTNTNDSGAGSLRDTLASADPADTIDFDASLAGATIHLASPITLSQDVTIDGSALSVPITISGDSDSDGVGDVTIFMIDSGVTVILNSLVLTRGNAVNDSGGAISNNGTLTINNSTLIENHAQDSSYSGGAIYSSNALTVNNSNFLNNTAPYGGGAIQAVGTLNISNSTFSYSYTNSGGGGGAIYSAATTTITDSTFTHNTAATVNGGGIYVVNGTTTVTGSTFAYNSAGAGGSIAVQTGTLNVSNSTFAHNTTSGISGGIYNYGTVNLYNSTFSDNSAVVGTDIENFGTLNFANNIMANTVSGSGLSCSNGGSIGTNLNNLIEDTSPTCSPALTVDPQLDTLADNGGPTQTMAPLPGSPAIDAGDNTTCTAAPVSNLDQRGVTRPFNTNCDLGAVEYLTTYVVTDASDPGDGTCDASCTLRDAVIAANADAIGDSIIFNGDYTITLGASLPSATDDLTIDGKGHTIILDGASTYQIMDAQAGLHLKNLTIQHANSTSGAILTRFPSSIANVTFANNTASSNGGAVYNYQTTLMITNSTFTGNTAGGGGGAIKNDTGTLIISNSTFSGNSADTGGAIVALFSSSTPTTTITNSTFSGNTATTQAGGIYSNGTLNYANTIIANSTTNSISGGDCVNDGTLGLNLNNLVQDASCSATLSGDPNLGTLANNGGSTQTLALLAHSTAINAGNDAVCVLAPVNSLDQRGTARPDGPHCDIGAYEYVDTTDPSITAFSAPSASASLSIPITGFIASDDVAVTGYKITESSAAPSISDPGWTASAPTTYTVGSVTSYTLYAWVKDATGHISAIYSPVNVTVDTTTPTVSLITRVTASPTAKTNVQFLVTFSEAVMGVNPADFSLTPTNHVTGAAVTLVSGSGTTRTVTVNTGSGDGSIRLNVPNPATITDLAGNNINGLPYLIGPSYTINKTLNFPSAGTQDGFVLESSETSNRGGTFNSTSKAFNLGDDATKKQYLGILSFNTGNIPDNAIITGVTLKVKTNATIGGGNPVSIFQGFIADIKNGFFGTSSALQNTDFQAIGTASYGPFIVTPVNNVYSINLTGGKLNINKLNTNSGLTQIRLRFKLDDNNNAVANDLSLFSGNATNAADRPLLVITYRVP